MEYEMPKIHPREKIVNKASGELLEALIKIQDDLTTAEYMQVLSNTMSSEISSIAKYMIRSERHPNDPNKPGGLAQ